MMGSRVNSETHNLTEIFATNKIVTPKGCAFIVNEILKVLLYQKSQIPFPYTWLKTVVNRKRSNPDADNIKENINFSLDKHFQIVSKVYDTLEELMKSVHKEFRNHTSNIREVLIIFGATPFCPKEVFRIKINGMFNEHSKEDHIYEPEKFHNKIIRNVLLSPSWVNATQSSIPCTNTYIFIKKSNLTTAISTDNDSIFVPSAPFVLPSSAKHFEVNLNVAFCGTRNYCNHREVFDEQNECKKERNAESSFENDEDSSECVWSQSRDLLKGFKDRFVNNVSLCELW